MPENQLAHDRAIKEAMHLLASGAVSTKGEAANAVGISRRSLAPDKLVRRSQVFTNVLNVLDVVSERDGEALSLRQVLSEGATAAVRGLATISRRIDQPLTRDEAAMFKRCNDWLTICDRMALFKRQDGDELSSPSGDAATHSSHLSVESWLRSHKTIDGRCPTTDKMKAQVIDTPTSDSATDSPAKDKAD